MAELRRIDERNSAIGARFGSTIIHGAGRDATH
jgi:hypothetical protein